MQDCLEVGSKLPLIQIKQHREQELQVQHPRATALKFQSRVLEPHVTHSEGDRLHRSIEHAVTHDVVILHLCAGPCGGDHPRAREELGQQLKHREVMDGPHFVLEGILLCPQDVAHQVSIGTHI